jgi:flagellar basal body-associated protein FliL
VETPSTKRNFFEKPSMGSIIVFLVILALVLGFGLYWQRQTAAKAEAAQRAQVEANKQAYRDGVEHEGEDLLRSGFPKSEVVDTTVRLFRQSGATDFEIEALKKRLSVSASGKGMTPNTALEPTPTAP